MDKPSLLAPGRRTNQQARPACRRPWPPADGPAGPAGVSADCRLRMDQQARPAYRPMAQVIRARTNRPGRRASRWPWLSADGPAGPASVRPMMALAVRGRTSMPGRRDNGMAVRRRASRPGRLAGRWPWPSADGPAGPAGVPVDGPGRPRTDQLARPACRPMARPYADGSAGPATMPTQLGAGGWTSRHGRVPTADGRLRTNQQARPACRRMALAVRGRTSRPGSRAGR